METFARIGNNLSADFVNTVVSFDHDGGTLRTAGDVVDFLSTTSAIPSAEADRVRALIATPDVGQRFLSTALELRAAVTAALEAIEHHESLAADSLAHLNAILALDAGFELIEPHDGSYRLQRRYVNDDPAIALIPIARDVATLVATPGAPVRHCAGDGCVRHFYDDSRTGRRRWCDMAICGNRAKALAFSKRQRALR